MTTESHATIHCLPKKKANLAAAELTHNFFSMSAPLAPPAPSSTSQPQLFVLEGVILDKSITKSEYRAMYPSNDFEEALIQQKSAFTFMLENGTESSDSNLMNAIAAQVAQTTTASQSASQSETASS